MKFITSSSRASLRSLSARSSSTRLATPLLAKSTSSFWNTSSSRLSQLATSSLASPFSSALPCARNFSTTLPAAEKKYTEEHEWIELSPDGTECTIGVSVFAAKALGDVVYVELPAKDLQVNSGDAIGAVESVKSASDIYSPLAGTVIDTNSVLEEKPATINKSPEGDGWIAKIKLEEGEADKLSQMLDAEAYAELTKE